MLLLLLVVYVILMPRTPFVNILLRAIGESCLLCVTLLCKVSACCVGRARLCTAPSCTCTTLPHRSTTLSLPQPSTSSPASLILASRLSHPHPTPSSKVEVRGQMADVPRYQVSIPSLQRCIKSLPGVISPASTPHTLPSRLPLSSYLRRQLAGRSG